MTTESGLLTDQEVFQAQVCLFSRFPGNLKLCINSLKYIPKQKHAPPSSSASMLAYISTFPALGQVTQIDHSTSVFTALLEVDESRVNDPWQLSLWHTEGQEWREVPMDACLKASSHPTCLQSPKGHSELRKLYFTTPLAIHRPTNFTIKFRNGDEASWKWVKDHQGTTDGIVMLKTVTSKDNISINLGDYVEGLNPELQSKNRMSQTPGTTVWSVETSVEPASGTESSFENIEFGMPWGSGKYSRWVEWNSHFAEGSNTSHFFRLN